MEILAFDVKCDKDLLAHEVSFGKKREQVCAKVNSWIDENWDDLSCLSKLRLQAGIDEQVGHVFERSPRPSWRSDGLQALLDQPALLRASAIASKDEFS